MIDWLEANQSVIAQLGNLSLVLLALLLVILPVVVTQLPADYFVKEKREASWRTRKHPLLWGALTIAKNLIGVLLILVGVAMLVLPGQGTLTILIGLSQTNFPGKFRLEQRIVSQATVANALNKMRSLANKPPFEVPRTPA